MQFEEVTIIAQPAARVVHTMLWELESLVPFMDNVESIETRRLEKTDDGRVLGLRHWQGTSGQVPAIVRPFVSRAQLGWLDHAVWYPSEHRVTWRIENSHSAYARCEGENVFAPDPDRPETHTRCVIRGVFDVDGAKLPAVPAFVGRKIAPRLEEIVIGHMRPNFRQLAAGLEARLRQGGAA